MPGTAPLLRPHRERSASERLLPIDSSTYCAIFSVRVVDGPAGAANTFPNGELSRTAGPRFHGTDRPDAAGDTGATRAQGRRVHQRAGGAVHDPAAGGDEASQRAGGCRTRHTLEIRPHGDGAAAAAADARGNAMAAAL